jgi:hypothetical protein
VPFPVSQPNDCRSCGSASHEISKVLVLADDHRICAVGFVPDVWINGLRKANVENVLGFMPPGNY